MFSKQFRIRLTIYAYHCFYTIYFVKLKDISCNFLKTVFSNLNYLIVKLLSKILDPTVKIYSQSNYDLMTLEVFEIFGETYIINIILLHTIIRVYEWRCIVRTRNSLWFLNSTQFLADGTAEIKSKIFWIR